MASGFDGRGTSWSLNLGGKHMGVDATRNSAGLIPASARDNGALQRKIMLDEIESLVLHHPGTSGADRKQARATPTALQCGVDLDRES
jgi:hypothetical protein